VTPLTYSWSANPAAGVSFSPSAAVEAPVVSVDNAAGAVTLTLTVQDEFNPAVSDTVVINVYGDACSAAAEGAGLTAQNPEDLYFDCQINLQDFARLAAKWLEEYALLHPIPVP
jgi:hypothetical protein